MRAAEMRKAVEQEILTRYPVLYRLAYTYTKNPDDAMDVVQDSVCKAMVQADQVRDPARIFSWLCRIVVNTALDQLRSRKNTVFLEDLPDPGQEDRYEDPDLLAALDSLESRERTVVVLRFFQDMKLQDIARVLGLKENTVKSILYRSLKKLRVPLSEGGIVT